MNSRVTTLSIPHSTLCSKSNDKTHSLFELFGWNKYYE